MPGVDASSILDKQCEEYPADCCLYSPVSVSQPLYYFPFEISMLTTADIWRDFFSSSQLKCIKI